MTTLTLHRIVRDKLLAEIRKNIVTVLRDANVLSNDDILKYEQYEDCLKTYPEKLFDLIDIYILLNVKKISKEEATKRVKDLIGLDLSVYDTAECKPTPTLIMIRTKVVGILKKVVFSVLTEYYEMKDITKKKHTLNGYLLLEYIYRHKFGSGKPHNISRRDIKKLKLSLYDRSALRKISRTRNI